MHPVAWIALAPGCLGRVHSAYACVALPRRALPPGPRPARPSVPIAAARRHKQKTDAEKDRLTEEREEKLSQLEQEFDRKRAEMLANRVDARVAFLDAFGDDDDVAAPSATPPPVSSE